MRWHIGRYVAQLAWVTWIVAAPRELGAQEILLTGPMAGQAATRSSPRSQASRSIILPSGYAEVGSELVFLMSEHGWQDQAIDFTDMGLARLRARRAFGNWLEFFAGTQLLAKQPSHTDEPIWQGGTAGLRLAFAERYAWVLGGKGGPMLNDAGWWWQLAPSLMVKPEIADSVRFVLALGNAFTVLDYSTSERLFWLEELSAHAEVQAGERGSGGWIAFDYDVPFASSPEPDEPDQATGLHLDPQIRLSFEVGGVVSIQDTGWSMFAAFGVVDRGEWNEPGTQLPILDGGFDQQQTLFGVQYLIEKKIEPQPSMGL
jgi:hypothetical protein